MKYREALINYEKVDGERSIFLAGGIIGCAYDWQQEMVEKLSDTDLVILNPRRNDFPSPEQDPYATSVQIMWEYEHLRKADMISFWFPAEAPCMTSLFELGSWSMTDKPLFVGIEPGYVKEGGIRKQLALVRPEVLVVSSLDDLVKQVKDWR